MTREEIALLQERRLCRQLRKEIERDLYSMQIALRLWRIGMLTGKVSGAWLDSALCQLLAGLAVIADKQKVMDEQKLKLKQLCQDVAELAAKQCFVPVGLLVCARGKDGHLDWASLEG